MKVIIKSYYKNSSLFNEGEFVKPISSDSSQDEIENFLKEKITHEGFPHGNYSKSEIKFIEKYLSNTEEYNTAKKTGGFINKKNIFPILIGLVALFFIIKLIWAFFGWLVFLTAGALIVYPLYKGIEMPVENKTISYITGFVIIFLWFSFGGSGSNSDFIDKGYIGTYCEEGYSNKCIEFLEDGSFKSNNMVYGTDYLGNFTYFGSGTWDYNGEKDPISTLFSDCYMTLDYDDVEIQSSMDCCPIEEDLAFKPGSSYKDGRARFKRLFVDPISYETIGCIDYIKTK